MADCVRSKKKLTIIIKPELSPKEWQTPPAPRVGSIYPTHTTNPSNYKIPYNPEFKIHS